MLPLAATSLLLLQAFTQFIMAQSAVKAGYWFPESGFPVADIDAGLFTHLFCAFADLDPSSNQVTISSAHAASFSAFTSTVMQKNPSVVTLLSIGGGSASPDAFSAMASQASSRDAFISSSIQLARSNGFSGLDLDWEYPQNNTDMTNLGTLFNEWRTAIDAEAASSGNDAVLLTAAVSVSSTVDSLNYPVDSMSNNVDWLNVMAYDFYAPRRTDVTSAHAALFDPSGGASGSSGIQQWMNSGMPANKLALGLPFYGYAWNLANAQNHGLGAAAPGPATGAGIAASDGSIGYNQIKAFIKSSGAKTVYDNTVVVNYCYSGTTWIGYDDVEAVAAKVGFAKDKGLLGYFAWSVAGDDNWALSKQAASTWG